MNDFVKRLMREWLKTDKGGIRIAGLTKYQAALINGIGTCDFANAVFHHNKSQIDFSICALHILESKYNFSFTSSVTLFDKEISTFVAINNLALTHNSYQDCVVQRRCQWMSVGLQRTPFNFMAFQRRPELTFATIITQPYNEIVWILILLSLISLTITLVPNTDYKSWVILESILLACVEQVHAINEQTSARSVLAFKICAGSLALSHDRFSKWIQGRNLCSLYVNSALDMAHQL